MTSLSTSSFDFHSLKELLSPVPRPAFSASPPRILVIGAGSRGCHYAEAMSNSSNGILQAIAEPIAYKRRQFGLKYVWGESSSSSEGQEFPSWKDFLSYELARRERASRGEKVPEGVDAAFVCVLDEMHRDVIVGLNPLGLHIMCEKPLATNLRDCVDIWKTILPIQSDKGKELANRKKETVFSIGHVLRYSPHNMVLRKLVVEERMIGDVLSVNHTEPVGWWHFTHSYVRGNWRKESTSAPTLLTKSCHDIDFLLWLLSSPPPQSPISATAHIPAFISSTGSLQYFRRARKPPSAGSATNCLSCSIESSCKYSAKGIYIDSEVSGIASGNTGWPVKIVIPEIEEVIQRSGRRAGEELMLTALGEDYSSHMKESDVEKRNWFGRCVYECDNNVCDEQVVTMAWEDDPLPSSQRPSQQPSMQCRAAKTAIFHMVAQTKKICERYSHIYGVDGEIYADGETITLEDFRTGHRRTYKPPKTGGGHGGGDDGLVRQFILAVDGVKNFGMGVQEAQGKFVGCSVEEIIRSHAIVFAAEEARRKKEVVDFRDWWEREVLGLLHR